ncbi:MAG: hypothetical protein M5R42_04830 [Rhodocyclaceae bacterium]|nr:hypothetical protein [Rhodocyclaceae bacterium]
MRSAITSMIFFVLQLLLAGCRDELADALGAGLVVALGLFLLLPENLKAAAWPEAKVSPRKTASSRITAFFEGMAGMVLMQGE